MGLDCGGTPTVLTTLPVGTSFHVCNGAWEGMITEMSGVKHVRVVETGEEFPLTGHNEHMR